MTKFISDISSPWEREYHLRKHKNWLLMERKAQKLHRKKKKIDESIKVEEKRYRAMRPVGNEKKTYPAGAPQTNSFFLA